MIDTPWLSGWQEIADYLRISIRTAQLWEREGMPVVRAKKGGVVSAHRAQLDAFKINGIAQLAKTP